MNIKYLILACLTGFIIALDQLSKAYIWTHYQLYQSTPIIRSFFNITYARNTGAAFSFLASAAPKFRQPFFMLIPLFAMIAIIWILRETRETQRGQIVALSFIFAGALGNYIDRLRVGYVVDFLDFHWKEVYHFAAFNVADSAICVGVALLLLQRVTEQVPPVPVKSS
jgi:signal peptidase II